MYHWIYSKIQLPSSKKGQIIKFYHDNSNTFPNQLRFVFQRSNYLRYQYIRIFFSKEQRDFQMMFASFNSNTADASSGTGTTYRSGVHTRFCWVRLAQSFLSCVVFCRSLFDIFSFSIRHKVILSDLLRYTASDYIFDILDIPLLITSLIYQIYGF